MNITNRTVTTLRVHLAFSQLTGAAEGVAKYFNLLYLSAITRHIVIKFGCFSDYNLRDLGVHTDRYDSELEYIYFMDRRCLTLLPHCCLTYLLPTIYDEPRSSCSPFRMCSQRAKCLERES